MDSRERPDYDHTGEGADEDMRIEADLSPDIPLHLEIEMQTPESGAHFNDIADTQHTSMDVTVPAPPSTSALSRRTPSSASQRTSIRRNRVEDDHDDERDRRHPSERLGSPSRPANTFQQPSNLVSTPPHTSHLLESTVRGAQHSFSPGNFRLNPFHFFRHILPRSLSNSNGINITPVNSSLPLPAGLSQQDGVTSGPSSQTPVAAAVLPSNDEQRQSPLARTNMGPHYLGGFTITIDANGSTTATPLPTFPNASSALSGVQGRSPSPSGFIPGASLALNAQTSQTNAVPAAHQQEAPALQQPWAPPDNALDGTSSFADILARIGLLAALSFRDLALFERDVDDPERAKKLVDGLEDVPVGLIKRLERVGKTDMNNEHENRSEDRMETSLGDNGCTICWEKLLLEAEEPKQGIVEGEKILEQINETPANPQALSSLRTQLDASASPSVCDSERKKRYHRIVTLPCAHVFHADCLIPWFSKPKQTTCPICRFNIDPENLTYTNRAQRPTSHAQTHQNDGGNGTHATTGAPVNDEIRSDPAPSDIPLMFAGGVEGPPITIPLGGGMLDRDALLHPGVPTPTNDPAPPGNAEDADANADRNRLFDMFTIGFDMYIEQPPSLLGGPNVFQIPVPGLQNSDNNTGPFPLFTNPPFSPAGTPVNATGNNTTNATSQGGVPTRGPTRATIVIPLEMGPGLEINLADIVTRIVSGNSLRGGNTPAVGGQAEQGGPTQNQMRQIPFGPERPPITLPGGTNPVRPGFGGIAGLHRVGMENISPVPFLLPFGNHSGMMGAGGIPQQSRGSLGISGGMNLRPGGVQPATGIGASGLPAFDIASGLFGGPPLPGPRVPAAFNAQPLRMGTHFPVQLAQPRPRYTQDPQQGQEGFGFLWFPTGSSPFPPASTPAPHQQVPRKKWTLPPPPGLTLRQKVEKREQEVGLRCCDVSCGVGPSDEDPWVHAAEHGLKQLSIRASPNPSVIESMTTVDSGVGFNQVNGEGEEVTNGADIRKESERKSVCSHMFHSSCLVSSERVSLALRDAEVSFVGPEGNKEVEVSCPVCRGSGRVSKEEWDAGIEALHEARVALL